MTGGKSSPVDQPIAPGAGDDGGRFPSLLLNILDSIEPHVALLEPDGTIRLVNAAWRRFGLPRGARPDAYVGENYLEVCERAAAQGDPDAEVVRRGLCLLVDGAGDTFSHHYRCADKVFQLRAARIDAGRQPFILLTHDDVTAVSQARDELSQLAERLLEVQEDERRRIALELHDSTSQHLVALQLGLAAIRGGRATARTFEDMEQELAAAHKEIRNLSYLLHPPKLARDKLAASLRTFVEGFRQRTGLAIRLTVDEDVDGLPFAIQRTLFRVAQEAMSNAHRHARARSIAVEIRRKRNGVKLQVADDGRGVAEGADLRTGLGIAGMDARLRRHQGVFAFEASAAGARVSGFIPASGIEAAAARADP